MKENLLIDLSKKFAIDVVNICNELLEKSKNHALINQLLRSGTSIGANIHEGNVSISRKEFVSKFQIALKECYETQYWLELFKETKIISQELFDDLYEKSSKIRKLLSSSVITAKNNFKK